MSVERLRHLLDMGDPMAGAYLARELERRGLWWCDAPPSPPYPSVVDFLAHLEAHDMHPNPEAFDEETGEMVFGDSIGIVTTSARPRRWAGWASVNTTTRAIMAVYPAWHIGFDGGSLDAHMDALSAWAVCESHPQTITGSLCLGARSPLQTTCHYSIRSGSSTGSHCQLIGCTQ